MEGSLRRTAPVFGRHIINDSNPRRGANHIEIMARLDSGRLYAFAESGVMNGKCFVLDGATT